MVRVSGPDAFKICDRIFRPKKAGKSLSTQKAYTLTYGSIVGNNDETIDEVLAAVDLADTGKKRAGRFSMGMRQRLGLALALIALPRLLVLDEPTNGLDPIGIEELRDQIRGFAAAGTTVIVSSHILSEVQQMADTIGIICGGRLAYEDALRPEQDLEELFMSFCREGRRARGEVAA